MQNKKVIILIVLSVFALISLVRGMTAGPKYKSRAAAPAVSATQPQGEKAPQTATSMERRAKRTAFKEWKRSPFVPAGSTTSTSLVLNGIIWSKTNPRAMIGDVIVKKGDRISDNRVVEVKPDRVILNDGARNFELKMEK